MSNMITGVIVLVVVAIGAMGFLMISNEGGISINKAMSDPVNNTGIQTNTSGANATYTMTTAISDNLNVAIFLAILVVILVFFGIYRELT